MRKWALPEAIDDVLPAEAARLEALRRRLLDHFAARGYRLVRPPLIEHLDSLLTGSGRDLELQTFKIADPMSGHMLGVRADITPQVARIDAHLLNEPGVTRLCYAGSVLRTVATGPGAAREVIQVGAELFGEPAIAGDTEVIGLLLSSLEAVGLAQLHLDLGHVGLYRALAEGAGIAGHADDNDLFEALSVKDAPTVATLSARLAPAWRDAFRALPSLYGPADEVLRAAAATLPDTPSIAQALEALAHVARESAARVAGLSVDLGDLRGYHYQNGVIFSVYTGGEASPIGNGGRYDGIGKAFGRGRAATGFTLDLRQVAGVLGRSESKSGAGG
jgi:ATP phosphoribosyltransferase regulatory subunit